ncbi:O-methyltransferase [Rhizobium redzepovicii]|uniref:O-methyltransferase n=1 Tax=Rhizobium redzepovicii TaxID=2867518 RepID=A0AAW8NX50_9HYPH|nr:MULTISPECIES: O-methyltransferase [Rhizobium]MBB3521737.1 putative O-methyltransferase YrrM [Rhizobium sp. BK456]MBY4588222.1 O-methyltransferase [Rhizobium redzepovicii]MBY4616043.1 O-methyltransferase [Rhizobium redzepovicii]MDF0660051.1 O-methyltransferase [Rhizobium sp. BC49]MDR9758890.1 O-methyltransferase [Rhizobium redzepovicii]
MTTLTTSPLAPLLEHLFEQADKATSPGLAALSREERDRLFHSKTEYRNFYGLIKDLWLPVSRRTGELLYMLARASGAREIVEFGTSFGISTLYLAAALRDNGGGRLITTEFEPDKISRARQNLAAAGLADLVEFRQGDALETLVADLPGSIDLVLMDGAKSLYLEILYILEGRLRQGAIVIADDADACPEYLGHVRAPGRGYMSTPFSEDIELSMRAC